MVFDLHLKALSHFVAVQYFASAQADILFAAQGAIFAAGGLDDLLQFSSCGGQEFGPLTCPLLGQQRIVAGQQAFAGKVRMADLG